MKRWILFALIGCIAVSAFSQSKDKIKIAVVPFKNNTGDKQYDAFTAGIGETLSTLLTASGKFQFIERIQMDKALTEQDFQLSDNVDAKSVQAIGEILGVEYILIGDLQKAGERYRINARRMRVSDGTLEESATASGEKDDLFDLQDEVAEDLLKKFEE